MNPQVSFGLLQQLDHSLDSYLSKCWTFKPKCLPSCFKIRQVEHFPVVL